MPRILARGALTLLALLSLGYLAICGLMYLRQDSLVYYPQSTRVAAADTDFSLEREGLVLRGWHHNPGRDNALIYFGGNAESVQRSARELAAWFPGRSIYVLAYRGYGASEGRPSEAALTSDALALFDHVRGLHPKGDIAVVGRSLGSGVAAQLAGARPVDRLALITPFDSLSGVAALHYPWLPVRLLMKDDYDSTAALADFSGPVFILEAGRDTVVPAGSTQRLVEALPRAPTRLRVPGADHDSALATPVEVQALKEFVSVSLAEAD